MQHSSLQYQPFRKEVLIVWKFFVDIQYYIRYILRFDFWTYSRRPHNSLL